jgi:hypothetical protein
MRELLAQAVVDRVILVHPYPDQLPELERLIDDGNPCIIPRRDPGQVFASWCRYGKNPDDYANRTLDEWMAVQAALALRGVTFFLDIDQPGVRDVQLAEINRELDLDLVTDWQAVRQAVRKPPKPFRGCEWPAPHE